MYWKLWTAEAPFGSTLLPLTSGKMERYSSWPDFVPHEWNTRFGSVSSYLPPPTQVFRVDPRYKAISPEVILEIPKSMQHRLGSAGSHPSPPGFLFSFVKFKSEKTCGANSRAFFTYSRIPSNSFLLVKLYIRDVNFTHSWSYECSTYIYFVSAWINLDTWETSWGLW